jgi:starch-binding outer membrane protein, SusD/RagB family
MKKNLIKMLLLVLLVGFVLGSCKNMLVPDPDNQYNKDRFKNDAVFALGMLINAYQSGAYMTAYPFNEVITDDAVTNDQSGSYYNYQRMVNGEWGPQYYYGNVWAGSGNVGGTSGPAYANILSMNYFLTNIVNTTVWSWQDTVRHRMLRQRYTGEALGFRGYFYYRLLQQFGGKAPDGTMLGVPLVDTLLTTFDDWKVPRATFEATVQLIYSDLAGAVKLMPYRFKDIPNPTTQQDIAWNRINGVTSNQNMYNGERATAIKARTAILAASPAFNGGVNYNLVHADSAVQIVGRMVKYNGGFAATLGADPLFWDDDTDISNTDILWRTDYANNNTLEGQNYPPSLQGTGRVNPTQNFVDAFPMLNGYPITDPLSGYDPANPYANRDPRLNMIVVYNGGRYRLYGSVGNNSQINTQADNAAASGVNDGLNKQATYSTRTGFYLKKGLRAIASVVTGSTATARHFYPIVRWTELLLIYAEAANEKYGPDVDPGFGFTARDVIKGIRSRGYKTFASSTSTTITQVGIPGVVGQPDNYLASITSSAQMRDLIRNERRIELSFEGFRFWDLRRWNVPLSKLTEPAKGVSITGTTPKVYDYNANGVNPVEARAYGSQAYYGPIPYTETIRYPGVIQNAGW